MIEGDLVELVPRGPKLKTHYVRPSENLLHHFMRYSTHVKSLLAETFGLRKGTETKEYYFGGSYFAPQILSPIRGDDIGGDAFQDLRFLLNDDNYFASMRNMWSDFRTDLGSKSSFRLLQLPQLYKEARNVLQGNGSAHDIVAINMPWLGEFADDGLLAPLDQLIGGAALNPLDFHPNVWSTGQWGATQFGVPIYCTIEILAARKDLFAASGRKYPETLDELVAAAREFHRPAKEQYGIAWNGRRGMPIATTFMFALAAFNSSILKFNGNNRYDGSTPFSRSPAQLNLRIDEALEAIDYLRRLTEFSPPDIADLDWEGRIQHFISGRAAMAYCWTMRAARFEHEPASRVVRRVAYLAPPSKRRREVAAPIGGFLLTIPSHLPEQRRKVAMDALAWMASPEAMKAHVRNGFPVAPRFSVCSDPEALASSPIVAMVDRMLRQNQIITWARVPVPSYGSIERTLGDEIHNAVFGGKPAERALADAEARILGA